MVLKCIVVALSLQMAGCAVALGETIDFSTIITDLDGNPVAAADQKVLTLGAASATAMLTVLPEDKDAKPLERFANERLAQRIYRAGPVELTTASECRVRACITVTERDRLMDRIARVWSDGNQSLSKWAVRCGTKRRERHETGRGG